VAGGELTAAAAVGNGGAPASWRPGRSSKARRGSTASWQLGERGWSASLVRRTASWPVDVRPEQSMEAAARRLSCGGRRGGGKRAGEVPGCGARPERR
jgi:hypothetical protein